MKEESENFGLSSRFRKQIMASGPITSCKIDTETAETVAAFLFKGVPKSLQMVTAAMKLKDACFSEEEL